VVGTRGLVGQDGRLNVSKVCGRIVHVTDN
jgi:hypothetical protein